MPIINNTPFNPNRDAFRKRIEQSTKMTDDGCIVWVYGEDVAGYKRIGVSGRRYMAHRAVYRFLIGEIPEGMVIDHLCRNRACVNPEHLQPVTNRVNVLRGDGPTAVNYRKTHCKRGHALVGSNLRSRTTRGRECRECHRRWADFAR